MYKDKFPLAIPVPSIPTTIEETGISKELLLKLVAKVLHVQGTLTPSVIAAELHLPAIIVAPLLCIEPNSLMFQLY